MSKLGYVYELVLDVNKLLGYIFLNKYTVVYTNKTKVYCKVNGSDTLLKFEKRREYGSYGRIQGDLYTIEDFKKGETFQKNKSYFVLDDIGYFKLDENSQEFISQFKINSIKKSLKEKTNWLEVKENMIKENQENIKKLATQKEKLSDEISFLYKLLKELEEKEEEK